MYNNMKKVLLQSLIIALIPLGLFFCLYKIVLAEDLSAQLKGRILLQVESHGEAWYINPDNGQRYYLGRPADAFNLMRTLGLGISNADFDKYSGAAPKRLAGKILLKVQDKGQAYYVNPVDLKFHYLGRPADAFAIMKMLGLGISNQNLNKIAVRSGFGQTKSQSQTEQENSNQDIQNGLLNGNGQSDGAGVVIENIATSTEDVATSTNKNETGEVDSETATTTTCYFKGEYFRNTNLIGDANLVVENEKINFDWGKSLGPTGLGRTDNFSARWTASCYFDGATYEFTATFDDGMIVYLDDEPIITSWRDNVLTKTMEKEMVITAGQHDIRVEYYKLDNFGVARLSWEKVQ